MRTLQWEQTGVGSLNFLTLWRDHPAGGVLDLENYAAVAYLKFRSAYSPSGFHYATDRYLSRC